jgi:hypothetical protein
MSSPSSAQQRTLPPSGLRKEARRLARRLVDGKPMSPADASSDFVWMAVRTSAMAVAGARHGVMLRRGSLRKDAARWLTSAQVRIEATFAVGGAP